MAILGGAKVSDKLGVIKALLDKVDTLVVGGAMSFTFALAQGHGVGDSLKQADWVDACKDLLAQGGDKLVLPEDILALGPDDELEVVGPGVPDGWKGLDIGPKATAEFCEIVDGAGTLFWNGPMGLFEDPRFAEGTIALAKAVASAPGFTIVGGGDSAAALAKFGLDEGVDHVSTGGGASLELIEQGDLPGLAALRKASNAPRKPLISGNWKMNLTHLEAIQVVQKLSYQLTDPGLRRGRRLGPPALHRPAHGAAAARHRPHPDVPGRPELPLGGEGGLHRRGVARRCWPSSTAPTSSSGTPSGGRSSARPTRTCASKMEAVVAHGMTPILCVGETLDEREAGTTEAKVTGQIKAALTGRPRGRGGGHGGRLRAHLGHRHRPHRHARRRPGHDRPHPGHGALACSTTGWPTPSASSTAGR